ncbi:MAG: FtsW/RodA/SpoVE family cell cycle protein, partial [Anaerolineales bacterium]|nr:FtsW/RodA/SpoVE family cell cycle protein [Anaerolineales bacterium]
MGTRALINQPGFHASARRKIAVRGGDTILLLAVIALVVFGLLMLYSASWDYSLNILHKAPWYLFERQLIWVGIGIVIAFILARFDYHHWQKLALPGMILTIALLLGVLLVNEIRLGATRTIYNGSLQPSEGAKLVTVIYLSVWLYAKREQLHDLQMGLIPLGMILGIIGGLIYLQPDLSATGTVLILGGLLFFLAGGDLRQITLLLIFAIIVGW